MRVSSDDPDYQRQARSEADYWAHPPITVTALEGKLTRTVQRFLNVAYTGDPSTSWFEDLMGRGPYSTAAMLGGTEGTYAAEWLRSRASRRLDVYELSRAVIRRMRAFLKVRRFSIAWPNRHVRFIQTDLNFVRLPRDRYDVVWTSGCVHHLINLEHLFAEVESALRVGGLFALYDYVGERHLEYDSERLRAANEVLQEIPLRFRTGGITAIAPPPVHDRSPFEAIRSDEILTAAEARFEVVHLGRAHALFPLFFLLEFEAMEREAPQLVERVLQAEADACRKPGVRPCSVYALFRKAQRPRSSPVATSRAPT